METIGIKREGLTQEIVPDNTLGDENTIITLPNNSDNITVMGGAIRDTVLFHSFQEFNINDTEQVYFSNPDGIFNILTRVTGENSSQILGTLGVNGDANFFLINPNGIYFGENAQLDLRGSFTATTADSIFIDHFEFSATHPEPPPPLLTINVEPGIQYGMNHRDREIQNHGHLQVDPGNHLNLLGGSIFNTGSLTALGGKIEILGTKINISENSQIDVSAPLEGGIILIGGDERRRGNLPTADRVYIGEDVSIRANAIGAIGDGGQVIIWAEEITGFYGEIEARGGFHFGNGGFVEVSGKEYLIFSGFVDVSAPNGYNGIILLDPRNMIISNDPNSLSILTGNEILADDFFDTNIKILASSLEMLSGDIILEATENIIIEPGVNLNFNFPDSISFRADADRNGSGDFLMGANNTIFTRGGEIEIRGNNLMIGSLDTSDVTDEGGSISLLAAGDIDLQSLRSNSFLEDAGEIEVISEGGSIAIFETIHAGSSLDRGAPVYLEAAENIRIGIFNNPFEPAIDTRGFEGGGDITVISQNDTVSLANSDLMSGTLEGDAGDITIVGNSLEIVDSMITSEITLDGKVGTISLEGNESILLNGSLLMTDMAFGAVGMPGNILMNAQQVTLDDSIAIALSGGTEKSGNIEIAATALTLQNDSVLEVFSWREGGNLNITATDLSLNRSQVKTESNGINGGNISINIDNLTMRNN
ncbi:MAG: filamentous hemagglutinin N-terminal domain-containing protein, partial [Spirulina sp.]